MISNILIIRTTHHIFLYFACSWGCFCYRRHNQCEISSRDSCSRLHWTFGYSWNRYIFLFVPYEIKLALLCYFTSLLKEVPHSFCSVTNSMVLSIHFFDRLTQWEEPFEFLHQSLHIASVVSTIMDIFLGNCPNYLLQFVECVLSTYLT